MSQYSLIIVLYHVPVFIDCCSLHLIKLKSLLSLPRQTWLIIAIGLSSLLLASLVVHLRRAFPASAGHGRISDRRDYSCVPLTDINKVSQPRKAGVEPDDPDSQDETWSLRSGGSWVWGEQPLFGNHRQTNMAASLLKQQTLTPKSLYYTVFYHPG